MKLRDRLKKYKHEQYVKASKEFNKKVVLINKSYDSVIKEKDAILDSQATSLAKSRDRMILQVDDQHQKDTSILIKSHLSQLADRDKEISELKKSIIAMEKAHTSELKAGDDAHESLVSVLTGEWTDVIFKANQEAELFVKLKEVEFRETKKQQQKASEVLQDFLVRILKMMEKIKHKTGKVSASSYKHGASLESLAKMSMRIASIIHEMTNHNDSLLDVQEMVSELAVDFARASSRVLPDVINQGTVKELMDFSEEFEKPKKKRIKLVE